MVVQMTFQVIRRTASEGTIREATTEGLFPRMGTDMNLQVGVTSRTIPTVWIRTLQRLLSRMGSQMRSQD